MKLLQCRTGAAEAFTRDAAWRRWQLGAGAAAVAMAMCCMMICEAIVAHGHEIRPRQRIMQRKMDSIVLQGRLKLKKAFATASAAPPATHPTAVGCTVSREPSAPRPIMAQLQAAVCSQQQPVHRSLRSSRRSAAAGAVRCQQQDPLLLRVARGEGEPAVSPPPPPPPLPPPSLQRSPPLKPTAVVAAAAVLQTRSARQRG